MHRRLQTARRHSEMCHGLNQVVMHKHRSLPGVTLRYKSQYRLHTIKHPPFSIDRHRVLRLQFHHRIGYQVRPMLLRFNPIPMLAKVIDTSRTYLFGVIATLWEALALTQFTAMRHRIGNRGRLLRPPCHHKLTTLRTRAALCLSMSFFDRRRCARMLRPRWGRRSHGPAPLVLPCAPPMFAPKSVMALTTTLIQHRGLDPQLRTHMTHHRSAFFTRLFHKRSNSHKRIRV